MTSLPQTRVRNLATSRPKWLSLHLPFWARHVRVECYFIVGHMNVLNVPLLATAERCITSYATQGCPLGRLSPFPNHTDQRLFSTGYLFFPSFSYIFYVLMLWLTYSVINFRVTYLPNFTPSSTKLRSGTPFIHLGHIPLLRSCFLTTHAIRIQSYLYHFNATKY